MNSEPPKEPSQTEDLPWAMPSRPPGSADTSPTPERGDPDHGMARQRVRLASAALIGVGALNLVLAFPLFVSGLKSMFLTPEEANVAAEEVEKMQAAWVAQLAPGTPPPPRPEPDDVKKQGSLSYLSLGLIDLAGALLTLAGGVRMRVLRDRWLVILGALAAALPIASCSACCGPGEVVGGWALFVLFDPVVRRGFR